MHARSGKCLGGQQKCLCSRQMPVRSTKCMRRSANAWTVGKMTGRLAECLGGRQKCLGGWQCACAVGKVHARLAKCLSGRLNACAGQKNAWTSQLNVWRVGKCLGGWQSACAVGNVPGLVGKMSGRLAKCMCGWQFRDFQQEKTFWAIFTVSMASFP